MRRPRGEAAWLRGQGSVGLVLELQKRTHRGRGFCAMPLVGSDIPDISTWKNVGYMMCVYLVCDPSQTFT